MGGQYIEILAVTRPYLFNIDDNGRHMYTCNFNARARAPINNWEEDVLSLLVAAGVATFNVDTFIGIKKPLPTTDGPFTELIDTGGLPPVETHNGDVDERLSLQVLTRAKSLIVARTRALAIWRALDGVRNTTVV